MVNGAVSEPLKPSTVREIDDEYVPTSVGIPASEQPFNTDIPGGSDPEAIAQCGVLPFSPGI
jgi:hypothetical protein